MRNLHPSRGKSQIIYGRKPITDALEEGLRFERIYLKDSIHGDFEKEIRSRCKSAEIPLKKVPQIKLDKLTRSQNHQGIVGIMSLLDYQEIENVVPFLFEQGLSPLIIILDNIQDIRNIGAIARSSEALGAHAMILSGKNAGIINEDAIKTSAGSLLRIPVCREKNSLVTIQKLRGMGIKIGGSSLEATDVIGKADLSPPLAILLGSEGEGLHYTIVNECDFVFKIPLSGPTESLNVSVAGGIILYEVMRQLNN